MAVPTHWLIAVQAGRVLGGLFPYPYLTPGPLTAGFALPAGIGDVITGVAAVPVAYLVMRGGARHERLREVRGAADRSSAVPAAR